VNAGLVYLLACAVNGVVPDADLVKELDLPALYRAASRHMLASAVGVALELAGIHDADFERARNYAIRRAALMSADMAAVAQRLQAEGIWYAPLKGAVLQHLYPVYGMREMCDHDILVDAGRADDVREIMEDLGFSTKYFRIGNHDVYFKKPISNFEMHRALFGAAVDEGLLEYYRGLESRLLGDGCEKHFCPEDFYLYLCAHEYKHYVVSGTGLRSLLDIYVYLREVDLDRGYVVAEAEKMGIADFEEANRSLALRLFSGQQLSSADWEMLGYILSSGVYGTIGNHVENTMAKNGYGKIRYALARFFVPVSRKNKEYESFASRYPVFYEHKVLLPLLPFYRTIRAMRKGRFMAEARAIRDAGSS